VKWADPDTPVELQPGAVHELSCQYNLSR